MDDEPTRAVFRTLATAEEPLHVTEIARRTGRSRVTVYRALRALIEDGIVAPPEKLGSMPRYAVNPEHTVVKALRRDAQPTAREAAGGKLLVVEVDSERAEVTLRTDPGRGVGLEVWVTTLEEARALGKLRAALDQLGLDEVVRRVYDQ